MPEGRVDLGGAFREGRDLVYLVQYRDLSRYGDDHNDPRTQADLVTRFRVAVRLFNARAYREIIRGNPARAQKMAQRAGRYFGEYRIHYRHLRTLPGFRPNPTYGAASTRSAALPRNP